MHMIFSSVPSSPGVGKVRGEKWSPAEGGKGKAWSHPRLPIPSLGWQGWPESSTCPWPQVQFQQLWCPCLQGPPPVAAPQAEKSFDKTSQLPRPFSFQGPERLGDLPRSSESN